MLGRVGPKCFFLAFQKKSLILGNGVSYHLVLEDLGGSALDWSSWKASEY